MLRDEVLSVLRAEAPELRRLGVRHAALFGSVARREAEARSDIDILVELDPEQPMDVFAYAGLKRYIGGLFPIPSDVVSREGLKTRLDPSVLRDAIYAF